MTFDDTFVPIYANNFELDLILPQCVIVWHLVA